MIKSIFKRFMIFSLCLNIAIFPTLSFANAATWTVTHSGTAIGQGALNTIYSFKNNITGLIRTATGTLTMAQVGKLARFVISRRLAAFAALATVSSSLNYAVDDSANLTTVSPTKDVLAISYPTSSSTRTYVAVPSWGASYCNFAVAYWNATYPARKLSAYGSGTSWCNVYQVTAGTVLSVRLKDTVTGADDWYGPLTPTLVSPSTFNSTATTTAILPQSLKDELYGAELTAHATVNDLDNLFNYDADYQSPAATAAIDVLNQDINAVPVSPSFTDVTSPALDGTAINTNTGTGTATQPSTETATATAFPVFCTWASQVCSFIDWFKQPADVTDPASDKVTFKDIDVTSAQHPNIAFNTSCPAAKSFDLNLGIVSHTVSMPFDYVCLAATKLRPFVIAISYLHAAYIIFGRNPSAG